MSGTENVVHGVARSTWPPRTGVVAARCGSAARAVADRLQFRGQLGDRRARDASGGNQQKLVIGKWVLTGAEILIFDEPTRGIDIGAKAEVYRLIHELAGGGRGRSSWCRPSCPS